MARLIGREMCPFRVLIPAVGFFLPVMRFRCGSQAIRVLRMSAAVRRTVARHAAVISCAGGGVPILPR